MKQWMKKLRLRQILTIFLAGVALFVTTACNSGDVRGARPENPPVQMGGANNPHKGGGDGYTQYKMSTDPNVNRNAANTKRDSASADVQIISNQLIAANSDELLYPGSAGTSSNKALDIVPGAKQTGNKSGSLPTESQRIVTGKQPNAETVEKAANAFKDASSFIQDKAEEASQRPEMQKNPALGK